MARGLCRWAEKVGDAESWMAEVELDDGETHQRTKAEYEAADYTPSFWFLPQKRRSFSGVVSAGMKRVCRDFTENVSGFGFRKVGARRWARLNEWTIDVLGFHRVGSSYGAPLTASVSIRVGLSVGILNDPPPHGGSINVISDHVRRPNGYGYHHSFNAETWSTYERCLGELIFFMTEFAEPWFEDLKAPHQLLKHPELPQRTRQRLQEALSGNADPENISASLRAFGFKKKGAKE